MISYGMWYVLSLIYNYNQENKWDIILRQAQFTLDYVKQHINILQKGYKVDQYVVQVFLSL